jgi:small subunit ribosomal protein S16
VVAALGHFNPHSKEAKVDKQKALFYLEHGAQPSERVARLLKAEGVKLPKWVKLESKKSSKVRNPDKLRKNRPQDAEPAEAPAEAEEVEAPVEEEAPEETEAAEEKPKDDAPAEAETKEVPAEETKE